MSVEVIALADLGMITKFAQVVQAIGDGRARKAFAWAMNERGRKGFTAVKRALAAQSSLTAADVATAMKFHSAAPGHLVTEIEGRSGYESLAHFHAHQTAYGVEATVWGRYQSYQHAFMRNGVVYHREGTSRLPIGKLYGAGVAREMERENVPPTFYASAADVSRAIDRIVAGIASGGIPHA
jgi:hypothetical protein